MRRREFLGGLGGAAAWSIASRAQPQKAARVIGWLGSTSPQDFLVNPFLQGLRQEGFTEGENVRLVFRWAEGRYDRLREFATEFVGGNVDLIAAITGVSAQAARDATSATPTVFLIGGDPVEL